MKLVTQIHEQLLDTKTPTGIYLSLRDLYMSPFLLESSDYTSKVNHFSYICLAPLATFTLENQHITTQILSESTHKSVSKNGTQVQQAFTDFRNLFQFENQNLPFCYAGLFGYTGFDLVNYVEELVVDSSKDDLTIPDMLYHIYGLILVFNHSTNSLHIISHGTSELTARNQLDELRDNLRRSSEHEFEFTRIGKTECSTTDSEYLDLVHKAKQHCQQGDVFQLVLSRRFSQKFIGDEFNVYRALKNINPSPYLFYFDTGNFKLFGSSPEAQLVVKNEIAEIHPIAGTYKRTGDDTLDLIKANELLHDPKENAEHNMLIDLARNDLSKYCTNVHINTIKQTQFYSHVIHLVSKIVGSKKQKHALIEVLLGTFPAGTLSGAPKVKAVQLINALEKTKRNFYGGCIGFFSATDELNHAIMIRTFLSKNNTLYFQAGAGIVISSQPQDELNEINNKVSALVNAMEKASTYVENHNAKKLFA